MKEQESASAALEALQAKAVSVANEVDAQVEAVTEQDTETTQATAESVAQAETAKQTAEENKIVQDSKLHELQQASLHANQQAAQTTAEAETQEHIAGIQVDTAVQGDDDQLRQQQQLAAQELKAAVEQVNTPNTEHS